MPHILRSEAITKKRHENVVPFFGQRATYLMNTMLPIVLRGMYFWSRPCRVTKLI